MSRIVSTSATFPTAASIVYNPNGKVDTVVPKRKGVGGMMFNEGGGIVMTGRGLILFDEKTGNSRGLFTEWEGKSCSFNDLTTNDNGSVYTGQINFDPLSNNKPIPGSLFRVDPPSKVTKLWDGIEVTNGMGLSPDRKHLYHCDSPTGAVWVYDVTADGGVKDRRIFAKLPEGWPDGMAVDAEGGHMGCGGARRRGGAFRQECDGQEAHQGAGNDGDQPRLRRPRHAGPLHRHRGQYRECEQEGHGVQDSRGCAGT